MSTFTTVSPGHRALFVAAFQLLGEQPDPLARICLLHDAYPDASLREIVSALRDCALLFLCNGLQPAQRGAPRT
jgi:hypothetical protein